MGKHQIIFTSCKRGIVGENHGLQVYSHNEAFRDAASEHVLSLLAYQVPNLPMGEVMTDEGAAVMPRSFVYRLLPGGSSAIVSKIFLGRHGTVETRNQSGEGLDHTSGNSDRAIEGSSSSVEGHDRAIEDSSSSVEGRDRVIEDNSSSVEAHDRAAEGSIPTSEALDHPVVNGNPLRYDNFLSHAIIIDNAELTNYPCEFYNSNIFRSQLDPSETNNNEPPPFLSMPQLAVGDTISLETVAEFISSDNRLNTFKKMLGAMLKYKTARKRVVINDTPDNIIKWIAALHYALPLEIALGVNISTYEYDPSRGDSQVCGVMPEGTAFNAATADMHFTFDIVDGNIPDIRPANNTEDSFFDFIDSIFDSIQGDNGGNFDKIHDFHKFIIDKLSYRNADEEYYSAYALYSLVAGLPVSISLDLLTKALHMADSYAGEAEQLEVIGKILAEKALVLSVPDEYALGIFSALATRYARVSREMQESIRALFGEKAINAFAAEFTTKDEFIALYAQLEALCKPVGISLSKELLTDHNAPRLLEILKTTPVAWRWDFVVDLLCDFIQTHRITVESLTMEHMLGKLMGDVLTARLEADVTSGFGLINKILLTFAADWDYLTNLAFHIEGVILDVDESLISNHWQHVYDLYAAHQAANRPSIYNLFLSHDRGDQVFDMYSQFMRLAGNIKAATELFKEQTAIRNKEYILDYQQKIYGQYYDFLSQRKDSAAAKRELIKQIVAANISTDFSPSLIKEILETIPPAALSKENDELVALLMDYYRGQRGKEIPERLILLASGKLISKAKTTYELENAIDTARRIANSDTISLQELTSSEVEKYFNWTGPSLYACSKTDMDLKANFNIYTHTQESASDLIIVFAKESVRASKESKEYSPIMMFLEFLFATGTVENRQQVGKIYCKLSRQNLETLDESIKESYKDDAKFLLYWSEVHEIAVKTNPILETIGSFFRRRK